jgi:ABC-type branched-subunit amino acid transport system ATPase component
VIGGVGWASGAAIGGALGPGAVVATLVGSHFSIDKWLPIAAGLGVVLMLKQSPDGLAAMYAKTGRKLRARLVQRQRPRRELPPVPRRVRQPAAIELRDVTVRFGGVVALDKVNLRIEPGEIVGLIGPNGAGKTTLLDAISGFARASGSVKLGGRELGRLPPHRRIRAGLGRTFQQIELYDDLTVRENVVAGLAARERRRASEDDLQRTLELLELTDLAELPAGELSQGRRQLVSIARALIGDPRVVLLDEPASGLDTAESEWLGERLRTIRDSGVTILLVDHDMHLVLNLCEQIHVLDFGRLIASGPPAAIKADRRVTEAYLGSTHAEQTTAAT